MHNREYHRVIDYLKKKSSTLPKKNQKLYLSF